MKLEASNVLLPLQILAFVALAVTFMQPIFTTNNRWLILALVAILTATGKYGLRALPKRFTWLTAVFGCWAFATVFWSEQPQLTIAKSLAFLAVTLASICVGYGWAWRHNPSSMMNYLAPLTVIALLAGVLGRYSENAVSYGGAGELYQGLVNGSNMFGSMLAMCSPFVFWKLHMHWRRSVLRTFWLILVLVLLYYLFRATSRAAIMIVIITAASLVISVSKQKVALYMALSAAAIVFFFMLIPGKFEEFQKRYIYKNQIENVGVLYSREDVWRVSLAQAKAGGIVGGGLGVTINSEQDFMGGLTSVGYGREKANSQLAILEEVGIVGFAIYCLSLYSLFARLVVRIRVWPRCMEKRLLILLTGTLAAMLFGSIFEAWWVSPGSPESVYFWTLAGVALGVSGYNIGPEDAIPRPSKAGTAIFVPRRQNKPLRSIS